MNELIPFDFKGNPINVILYVDGEQTSQIQQKWLEYAR